MQKRQITLSLSPELARYVNASTNADALVSEALERHRAAQRREAKLARAYREDAEESRRLHEEWLAADSELQE